MQTNLHRGKSAANVILLSTAAATVEGRLMPKRHPARYFFQSSKRFSLILILFRSFQRSSKEPFAIDFSW